MRGMPCRPHYYSRFTLRCPDCAPGELLCAPEYASGKCAACDGKGGFPWPEDFPPPTPSAEAAPPLWPCEGCNGTGKCGTCGGVGALDDDAWEDCLVQPLYPAEDEKKMSDDEFRLTRCARDNARSTVSAPADPGAAGADRVP